MFITRAPFRVSFFGGGTDIPDWFEEHGGRVLSTTIDKYCYTTVRRRFRYGEKRIRVSYATVEDVKSTSEIKHPLIRTILQQYDCTDIEVHYDADLPGRSGLGSSSSFAVSLLCAINAYQGKYASKKFLSDEAIKIERYTLKEAGGFQDQIAAAFGGINDIEFKSNHEYTVNRIPLSNNMHRLLSDHMLLCYIPIERFSSDVSLANNFMKLSVEKQLARMQEMVGEGISLLQSEDIVSFSKLIKEAWEEKRSLKKVTNKTIDDVYETSLNAGAYGGKLLGAGGGGFFLIMVSPSRREAVQKALKGLYTIPISLDNTGVTHLYSDSNMYEQSFLRTE